MIWLFANEVASCLSICISCCSYLMYLCIYSRHLLGSFLLYLCNFSFVYLIIATYFIDPFHPCVPQWHVKDPDHSAKHAGGRLHLNTHTLSQQSRSELTMPLSRPQCGYLSGSELTRNLLGNTRPQSCQLAEPLWTDPGLKRGISVRELLSTLKEKRAGGELVSQLVGAFSPVNHKGLHQG